VERKDASMNQDAVKRHKAMIYDIDVTYYLCNADGCYHKAKVAGNLNAHKKGIHGVSKEAWK